MASTLSWVDFSEQDRDHMMQVIRMFAEPETVDELGIGTVRDALTDVLFPGTSTIQTRAAYFLFIPWIYAGLEGRGLSEREVAERARLREVQLIYALASSDDTRGVIGIEARERLKRFPSSIYWNGLAVWGIRRFPGSREQYHRWLASGGGAASMLTNDDGEPVEGTVRGSWHPGLPKPPPGFPRRACFRLRPEDAAFLQERIVHSAPRSFLAFLVREGGLFSWEEAPFPWEHPRVAHAPVINRQELEQARNFSLVMHGAALGYNLLLVEARLSQRPTDEDEERRENYAQAVEDWWEEVVTTAPELRRWQMNRFWAVVERGNPRIPYRTRQFVETWLRVVYDHLDAGGRPGDIVHSRRVANLLKHRERQLKGKRARFFNRHALDVWNGRSGADRLSYRWPVVTDIVLDILSALDTGTSGKGERDAAAR